MIFRVHIPVHPLSEFIDAFIYFERVEHAHTVDSCGTKKRNEVIAWLKSEHGFGHMNASLLAGIHANGGRPVYQSTDGLLESQFAKAVEMRPFYEAFLEFVKNISRTRPFFPKDVRFDTRKSRVCRDKHQAKGTSYRT